MEDDEIPITDDLEKMGFKFSSDGESMYHDLGIENGLHVLCAIETNTRSDNCGFTTSLALIWSNYPSVPRVSMSYGIRDNPTVKQIKSLLAALKGE